MLFTLYIICAIVGGGLVLLSALGGVGGHDADGDAGHDVSADHDATVDSDASGAEHELGHDHDHGHEGHEHGGDAAAPGFLGDLLAAFMSLRFWTYFLGGFGVLGVLLTVLQRGVEPGILLTSLGTGFAIGLLAAFAYKWVQRAQVDSGAAIGDYLGKQAKVLVPVRGESPGRVRLTVKDEIIDVLAIAEAGRSYEVGEEVYVIAMDDRQAKVAGRRDLFEDDTDKQVTRA